MENFNRFNLSRDLIQLDGSPVNELQALINQLDKCFAKENNNFAEICFVVFRIRKLFDDYKQVCVFKNDKLLYNFDSIMQGFGIGKTESSRILSVFEKFCCLSCSDLNNAKCSIIDDFKGFSKSKLFELLQVDSKQIIIDLQNKVLRFDFSVKQIREYVKNYQAQQRANKRLTEEDTVDLPDEIDESQIPMAYEPEKEYEFSYFETKTKSQLLNMIWDLQKAYQKLKREKRKK